MSADSLALWLLAVLALILHGGTLVLLRDCSRKAAVWADGLAGRVSGLDDWFTATDAGIAELVAIGTDLADSLEVLSGGVDSHPMAAPPGPQDPLSTVLSLIASRMMPDLDGGATGPEWAIYEQQADAPPVFDIDDDGSPTAF